MEFMHVDWIEDGTAYVTLTVRDYPLEGVTLDKLVPMIEMIRKESKDMIIRADMEGAGIINIDRFKSIVKIVSEVVEYTKDDNLLRQIQFIGTGFFFRMLYKPFSLAIPKYFREMVVFV
jgi:glycopeptide antibiotics resistance protein